MLEDMTMAGWFGAGAVAPEAGSVGVASATSPDAEALCVEIYRTNNGLAIFTAAGSGYDDVAEIRAESREPRVLSTARRAA